MTEDTPVTEVPAAPVIDESAVQQAKLDAEMKKHQAKEAAEQKKMMDAIEQRRKQEAEIAAVQEIHLKSIRDYCEAGRAALEAATRQVK